MSDYSFPLPEAGPIGVFDSGYGGLTILKEMRRLLPQYDYLYLGDNARAPYGNRSFDVVFDFTRQAVEELFRQGCRLVILACNTASAKALRSIQQRVLPIFYPDRRVLGVILPTVEKLGELSTTRHIGILGTPGTVNSHSYRMEIKKLYPDMTVVEQACPMWVPLVETNEATGPGADYFVKKYIDSILGTDPLIDTLILGCTHYPILLPKIKEYVPAGTLIIAQGEIVAESLKDYLQRHQEMDCLCSKNGSITFLTTENPDKFNSLASTFLGHEVDAVRINIDRTTEDIPVFSTYAELYEATRKINDKRQVVALISAFIADHPADDEALTLRGMKYWSLGERSNAINDYLAAIRLNPQSKAVMALKAANEILDFRNNDLYNP